MVESAIHVRGVVLPDETHRDLWIGDGRVTFEPVRGAETVADGWILPGLVDFHCHIGLDENGAIEPAAATDNAVAERDAGVLLIREPGSPSDTHWVDDRPDLPRIIRAGRHLARTRRYIRNYGWEIEPGDLPAFAAQEARRGDGWVKIVADWIDRDSGDLAPCWPADALAAAVSAAHDNGARVTAHVFGEDVLPDLLDAGVDGIEHGTGLSGELVATMAERGVSLVPTLINIANFPSFAAQGEAKFPVYASHMRRLYQGRYDVVRTAYEAGVPVFVGTDAGGLMGHGLIADEVMELVRAGIPAADVVAAASWKGRAYLLGGTGALGEGAAADLCVYAEDPRVRPETLRAPRRVVLRGQVVA